MCPTLFFGKMEEKDFEVEKIGSCVVIRIDLGENRLNPNFIRAMHKALDTAESYEDAKCLVTIGNGKYYNLGLDLEQMAVMSGPELMSFANDLQKMLGRLLTCPLVTVAAINGHVYAGGVFVALTHDYTVMRSERGWYCLSEVHIKRNFAVGYVKLAKARLPQAELHKAMVLGTRYTAEEAKAVGIINEVSPMEQLESRAIAAGNRLAGKDGLDRKTLAAIKHDLYRDVYRELMDPVRFYSQL